MRTSLRLLVLALSGAACSSTPEPAATTTPAAPVAPAVPPPAAAAKKSLPEGVTEAETHRATTRNGTYVVWWTSEPAPIPFNTAFTMRVWAARAATPDVPLTSAKIELGAHMPEHGHGMNRVPRSTPQPDGSVLVEGLLFHMRGRWELLVNVTDGGTFGQAALPIVLQ